MLRSLFLILNVSLLRWINPVVDFASFLVSQAVTIAAAEAVVQVCVCQCSLEYQTILASLLCYVFGELLSVYNGCI